MEHHVGEIVGPKITYGPKVINKACSRFASITHKIDYVTGTHSSVNLSASQLAIV